MVQEPANDDRGRAILVAWLEENQNRSHEELCLSLLDDLMKQSENEIAASYVRFERWLNRKFDQDVDKWLADRAPDALAFRNRELARGYDPIGSMYRLMDGEELEPISVGYKAVFADQDDQVACARLLIAMWGLPFADGKDIAVPNIKGWAARLQTWYWDNRSKLKYDWDTHRFAVSQTN